MPGQFGENDALQEHLDAVTQLRLHGYSQAKIDEYYANQVSKLRQAGYSEDKIRAYYGGTDPAPVQQDINESVQANQGAQNHESWVDLFAHGLTNSSSAALMGVKPTPYRGEGGMGGAVANALGETLGDLPVAIPSAFVGGRAAGMAVARVPGAAEAAPVVAGLAGSFNAGAGPQMVKSARDQWLKAGNQGWSFLDFLQGHGISAQGAVDSAKAGAASMAAGGAGMGVGATLERAGVSGATRTAATLATEGATYTAASAALDGHAPSMQDFVEGTVILGALHGTGVIKAPVIRAIRGRLQDYYSQTGVDPVSAANAATHDPVLKRQLLGEPNPPAPAGSSRSLTSPEPTAPGAPKPDQFVVPRAIGSFDEAVPWIMKEEGGLTSDTGGLTKYGISAKANPGIDIAHLSKEQAAEIYHAKYWNAIHADDLAPNMRLAAFDSAVNEGVGVTQKWLAESGGDVQKFLQLRAAKYAELARDPKYAPYAKAWAKRLTDLGASPDFAALVENGPNNLGKELTPEERHVAGFDLDQEAEGKPAGTPEEEEPLEVVQRGDEDSMSRVMARTRRDTDPKGGWLDDSVDTVRAIYKGLFQNEHPVNRLTNAVLAGGDLDDAANPMMIRRLAEGASDNAKYVINGDGRKNLGAMTDLEGNLTGGRSLKAIINDAGKRGDQVKFLDGYARSRWAQMMAEQGKETGIHPDDAARVVDDHKAKWEPLFQELVGYRNSTLGWLKGTVVDDALHDKLVAQNQASVPGYRVMDDGHLTPLPARGSVYSPIKTAKGSDRALQPLEEALIRETIQRRMLAESANSNIVTADAALKAGVAKQSRAVNVNVVRAIHDLGEIAAETDNEGIDAVTARLVKATGVAVPQNTMPVMRNGKMHFVEFNDDYKDVVPVVRGYSPELQQLFYKMTAPLRAVTSFTRSAQTILNPLFAPHIALMDSMFQGVNNPDAKNVVSSIVQGFGLATRDPKSYDEALRKGAFDHVFDQMGTNAYVKSAISGKQAEGPLSGVWNGIQSGQHMMQAWARLWMNTIRAGRYVQGQQAGESSIRSGVAATQSAYHRAGYGGILSKMFNSVAPFTTAHLSGLEHSVRALIGGVPETLSGGRIQNRTILGTPYNARATIIKGLAIMTIPSLVTYLANKDQEWYKGMPDWQKDNAIFIIPPMGNMPAIPIGGPAGSSVLFTMLPHRIARAAIEDDPHAFDNLIPGLVGGVMGPARVATASLLEPVIEHLTNHSFFRDQPLASADTVKSVGTPEQFNHYSSAEAKALSKVVGGVAGLSPAVIDNYIHQWGGIVGAGSQIASNAIASQNEANQRPEVHWWENAPFSSYVERYPSASAQPIQDFYARSQKLEQVHGSILKAMSEGDLARVQQLAKDDPSAAAYHQLRLQSEPSSIDPSPYIDALSTAGDRADWNDLTLVQEGQKAMKEGSKYIRNVEENPRLSPQDKRQILDASYQIMQGIAEQTNEAMDRAHVAGGRPSRHQGKVPDDIEFNAPNPDAAQ